MFRIPGLRKFFKYPTLIVNYNYFIIKIRMVYDQI